MSEEFYFNVVINLMVFVIGYIIGVGGRWTAK